MVKHFTLLLLSVLFCCATAMGQSWTLEQCIRYAWDNNISLQQQELTTQQYKNTLYQSKWNFAPSVGIRASENMSWGMSTFQRTTTDANGNEQLIAVQERGFSNSFSPSIYASITLFEGLKKISTLRRNQSDYNAAQQDVELQRNIISTYVAQAYVQVLLSMEILTVADSSYASTNVQLNRLKQLVDAGSRPLSEQLDMEAQLANAEVQRVTAQNNLEVNYLSLRQLLNIPPTASFEIAKPEIDIDNASLQDNDVARIYSTALNLPQIKAAEFRLQSAKHNVSIARADYWPTISLSGSFGSAYYNSQAVPFWDQLTDHNTPSLGFSLNIPLFSNWRITTNSKNAKLNYRMAELEVENKRQTLYKEIQTAATDASASYNKYKAANRNVTASQESFRYVEQKFETGLSNFTDYNVAKTNLLKAQSDELQAKYQYIFQLKILDLYRGLPIK